MTVESDVAMHLATALGRTYGSDVRPGLVRKASDNQANPGAVPDECMFVLQTAGINDEPWIDGGAKTGFLRPSVQVYVRSNCRDYDGGKALADSVWFALDKNPPTGYIESRALSSGPLYLREDDLGHHEWSINLNLLKQV